MDGPAAQRIVIRRHCGSTIALDERIAVRMEQRSVIVASFARRSIVFVGLVILCAFGVGSAESSVTVLDKTPNMQNVARGGGAVWSKVDADVDDALPPASTMSLPKQSEQQHHPHQFPLNTDFELRKMAQLSKYAARDRFDTSRRVSRLNNVAAVLDNGTDRNEHMKIATEVGKRTVVKNTKQNRREFHRRKRQTVRSQSLLINDKRLRQLRPNVEEVDDEDRNDRFPNAGLQMRKVLSVLIPNNQRRPALPVDDIWGNGIQAAQDKAVQRQRLKVENYQQPDVQGVRFQTFRHDDNLSPAKAQHTFHQQKQPQYLPPNEELENHTDNNEHFLPLTNACELCSSSPSAAVASSFRCCPTQDFANQDSFPKHHRMLIANNNPPNKSKRQTAQKVTNPKAINSYPFGRNQKLALHQAAVYPEIVAKTSSILATNNYRQPQPAADKFATGNSYADFLNYYDQHQQVDRRRQPNNILSSGQLLSPLIANAPAPPTTGEGSESLFPGVPNINITAQATSQPVPNSNPTTTTPAPDYYSNHNSSHLSTPLTPNAPSAATSVYNNNATNGAEGAAAGGGPSGSSGVGEETCAKYTDASNTSAVLQRVLDELERIRMFKEGQLAPEGQ